MRKFPIHDKDGRSYTVVELRAGDEAYAEHYGEVQRKVMSLLFQEYVEEEGEENFRQWAGGTHKHRRNAVPVAHLVYDDATGEIAGFGLATYMRNSKTAMLMFMGFLPEYQGFSLAKPFVTARIDALHDVASSLGEEICAVFAEIHRSSIKTKREEKALHQKKRLHKDDETSGISDEKREETFKDKLGAERIEWLNYFDPSLATYYILTYPLHPGEEPVTDPAIVREMIKEWYGLMYSEDLSRQQKLILDNAMRQIARWEHEHLGHGYGL